MPKISIIVPVYNVEKYLRKCIDSLIQQSYRDFEILLIDDGSTDKSGEISDQYAQQFNYISTYHKENGGLSDARNYGIAQSKGKYLTFVDSDDSVRSDYLETLVKPVDQYDADLVITGSRMVYKEDYLINIDGHDIGIDEKGNVSFSPISRTQCFHKILMQEEIDVGGWAKLYNNSIFESIRYPKGKLYEDIAIIGDVIEKAERIYYSKYAGYNYLQRPGSIMYGKMNDRRLSLLDSTRALIIHMQNNYPSVVPAAIHRYVYCNFHLLGRSIPYKECDKYSLLLRNNILRYWDEINNSALYTKKEKIAAHILQIGLRTYRLFWKAFCFFTNKKII